ESNPLGADSNGTALYPGASQGTPVSTPPGSTNSATVPLNTLVVHAVDQASGANDVAATVTATEDGRNCPAHTYGLQTTDINGLSTTGVPLGQFQVTATLGTKTASTYIWVVPGGWIQESAPAQQDPTGTVQTGPVTLALQ
ncbi:MAG TPA: hypothetical protein VKY15_01910, partial [Acidimicrobiales bacterium]|nr:hypothetical protein [Acidimicrobiales bacterium]